MIYIKLMLSWKSNLKNAAGWLIWQDAYVGMVPFQYPFAYRKTQAAPADRTASGFVHPEKRFKNGIPIFLWNTLALIGNLYLHGIFFFLYRNTYLCIRRTVFHRIFQ